MSDVEYVKNRILKILEKNGETDTFEIAVILKEPIEEVNQIVENMILC